MKLSEEITRVRLGGPGRHSLSAAKVPKKILEGANQQGRDLNRGKFQYRQLAGTMQADVSLRTAQTIRKILAAEAKSRKHT
jgi:hypothetical protein